MSDPGSSMPPTEPEEDPREIATGMTLADISIRNHVFAWVLMFALIGHWMIITEEEQLARAFGQEYESYCQEVPRYLRLGRRQSEDRLA